MLWLTTILLQITYQQTLFYSAFTDTPLNNLDNWSFIGIDPLTVIQQCGAYSIIGGFQTFGLGQAATKFLQLAPHYKIKISFTLFIIDTWDLNECLRVYVDQNIEYNQAYYYMQSQSQICGQSGLIYNDQMHEVQFEFQHTGSSAFIQLTSTLDQISLDESWGFRNFRLFLYLCPSGCLTCSYLNSQAECQTWIITNTYYTSIQYSSFTTDGWTISNGGSTKQQCSTIPSICGYGVCGQNTILSLSLTSLTFHTRMKIKFKYLKIDSWEQNDYALLKVNEILKWKQSLSGLTQYLYGVCGGTSQEIFINVELTFPHYLTTASIQMLNTLDQSYTDESFGVRDIEIFVQQSICGDTFIQENEECDDGNLDPFDGCFNCVYSCVDGCSICHKGTCLSCYPGWIYKRYASLCQKVNLQNIESINMPIPQQESICYDYIEGCQQYLQGSCIQCQKGYQLKQETNSCKSICGDYLITIDEECDGQNCNQCKFECPIFCIECLFGICQVCQEGYFLQNNWCVQEQKLNICQPQCEVCIDSVCYECQYGQILVLGQCQEICGNNEMALHSLDECTCNPYCTDCRFGYCHQCRDTYYLLNNTCVSKCGDLIVQENEECDDGNDIEFDGCFNCQFQCTLNCQTCQSGICLDSCQFGYYLINNVCSTKCGDQIIAGDEQCEDNNNINHDGCYLCQYSCPLYCNDCLNGECQDCNPGFILYNNTCTNICGDGILSDIEQCDDGNQHDGDGCSQNCFVEINWICNSGTYCTFVKYPTLISEYVMQKNQYQYVKIAFSQPVQQLSNLNYSETIKSSIIDLNETLFNITIMEVQPAVVQQTSDVEYVIQIEIFQSLDYYPILEIKLTEQLFNDNEAPLVHMIEYIQLKQPNYITEEQVQIASTFQQLNEVSVQSLCCLTIILLLLGNALSFWGVMDALQEQSYLKYINVLYPQTLIIYFQSSQVVSIQPALDTITLYKNEGKLLQFPYLQSYEKFEFYEINADIAEGIRAEIFLFVTLFAVYLSTFYAVKILTKFENSQFISKFPKFVRIIQKVKRNFHSKLKDTKKSSLQNTLRACTWDLIFMALLELKASHDFHSPRSTVCILIAISILIITLILLVNQVQGLNSWKKQSFNQFWESKKDIFQVVKKFLILYILVFYQYEQELQTLILTLINAFYLVYVIYFRYLDDKFEYIKSIVMETSLTIFTASTFVNWNIVSNQILYSQKIIIAWIQMSVLVVVLVIFIFIEIYKTYLLLRQKIQEYYDKRNKKHQVRSTGSNKIELQDQDQKMTLKQSKTIFSRAQYTSKIYPRKF